MLLPTISLVLRCFIAVLFLVAALAKLTDLPGTRNGIAGFGFASRTSALFSVLLPVVELSLFVSLLLWPAAGSAASALVLLLFSAVVLFGLLRKKTPACNCFGSLSSRPLSWHTLSRNVGLLLVASAAFGLESRALADGRYNTAKFPGDTTMAALLAVLFVAVVGLVWMVFQLWKQQGRLLISLDALTARLNHARVPQLASVAPAGSTTLPKEVAVGTPAPRFSLGDVSGQVVSLDDLLTAHGTVLLVFSHPLCGPCASLLPALKEWHERFESTFKIVVISAGTPEQNVEKALGAPLTVLLQQEREISDIYGALVTPSAVRISRSGRIDSPIARGSKEIKALVGDSLVGGAPPASALPPQVVNSAA